MHPMPFSTRDRRIANGRPAVLAPMFTLAFAALLAVLLAAPSVRAQVPDVFSVGGVPVDVTAQSAAAARERGLAEAEVEAYRRLMARLVLDADRPRVPRLQRAEVSRLVRDFSVVDEKTSSVRYLAKLTYRFRPDAVRALLQDNGVAFAETPSKPVLVLPILRRSGTDFLWEPNPWLQAWRDLPPSEGLVPLVLPLGDLTDIAAVSKEQALRGDMSALGATASRYGAADALVAVAEVADDALTGRSRLAVTMTRYGSTPDPQPYQNTFVLAPGDKLESVMARAVTALADETQDRWKRNNRLTAGVASVTAVTVPLSGLPDWLDVRKRLRGVAIIQQVEVVLLSRAEARLNLHYLGDLDQLVLALEQADLNLSSSEGERFLRPAAAARRR